MMSACYCTKSCQYHIKYPIHVYSDVIQRASYLDLELYSHSWRISALQTWLHHFFCCFDVFRMITMKTWLNAPGASPSMQVVVVCVQPPTRRSPLAPSSFLRLLPAQRWLGKMLLKTLWHSTTACNRWKHSTHSTSKPVSHSGSHLIDLLIIPHELIPI